MAKKETQIVIQSFVPHRLEVNFRHIDGDKKGQVQLVGNQPRTVRIPSKFESPKNILVLKKEDFEAVSLDLADYIKQGQRDGVVILDDIPSGYWDPAQRVAEAEAARTAAEATLAGAQTQIEAKDARIAELKGLLAAYGWKDDGK